MIIFKKVLGLLFILLTILTVGCSGVSPGEFKISQNNKVVYKALVTFDSSDVNKSKAWQRVGKPKVFPVWSTQKFLDNESINGLKRLIQGNVQIRLVCKTLKIDRTVTIRDLVMVRNSEKDTFWYLPKHEMNRLEFIVMQEKE